MNKGVNNGGKNLEKDDSAEADKKGIKIAGLQDCRAGRSEREPRSNRVCSRKSLERDTAFAWGCGGGVGGVGVVCVWGGGVWGGGGGGVGCGGGGVGRGGGGGGMWGGGLCGFLGGGGNFVRKSNDPKQLLEGG